ncbi:hypothetical protein [Aliarcobacter butzleri]|uniref:hypothetical protein n=1 Tax=Aliarcobacter butzleri TaxID=28197 RepID=UPI001269D284|nr:hypothetical protein [Aliarcobacter butzleri]
MSRKYWENNLINKFNKKDMNFSNFMSIHNEISSNRPYFLDIGNESEEKSHFLLLLSGLTNEELKLFYHKFDYKDLKEVNENYSIRDFGDNHFVVFNDNGFLASVQSIEEGNQKYFCSRDIDDNIISNTKKTVSSSLSFNDSLKEYIESTFINTKSKDLDFNHDKYFIGLFAKYTELKSKDINCDIYFSSEVGHSFVSKEQFLRDFNKNNATLFMLADDKGQCIFNKKIYEENIELQKKGILTFDDYKSKFTQKHSEDSLKEKYACYLEGKIKDLSKEQSISSSIEYDNSNQMSL